MGIGQRTVGGATARDHEVAPSRGGAREATSNALRGTGYRALGCIGVGAASEVFEAVGPLGELRAVKVLRACLAASGTEARFDQEARVLAALDHPHLVRVLDSGRTVDGRPYLVMPRLVGETLRDRLRRAGALPVTRACTLLAGALDGFEFAHRAGIVHRDAKPANLFFARGLEGGRGAPRERAILLDFGIAKMAASSLAATTGGHVVGTPRYLAPEQILGGNVDGRTDVYAMGVVVFEAVTGRGPYDAADWSSLMRAHVHDPPTRLRHVLASAPPELDFTIARALEKSPRLRWPTARAFAEALRRCARCA